jgi:protein associated with RNAse G/E
LGWYVNLQCPFRRTEVGIEAMDLMLDVVVDPDGTWRWKDD